MHSARDQATSPQNLRAKLRRFYYHHRVIRSFTKFVPILVLLGLWEVGSGTVVTSDVLPPFSATVPEIIALTQSPEFFTHLLDTIFRGLAGLFIAIAIAVPTGMAMGRSERVSRTLNPVVSLTYPLPKSPLIPLLVFWLGMGHLSRIMLAVVGSLLPILISAYNGAENIQKELLWVSKSLGLSPLEETYKVMIPAALPTILTGVRIGMIFSFIIVISSEMIMSNTGLGVLVVQFGQYGQYASVFATVFWITVLVAGLDRVYLAVSNYLLRWSDQEVGGI
ncbi:ABC transporter permease [Natronosalvus halobius]|uniref:ABC transporter permease n=1 Tax=Natronosalvus halobius TaxID=2953746 RepID=UPI0020A02EAA|nr:ABC transporter permease [Natronosalvus halobius]USZ73637.1 ABC transporter permease [Natronosalvus halobius]